MLSTISYIFFSLLLRPILFSYFRIAFPFCLVSPILILSFRIRSTWHILVSVKLLQNMFYVMNGGTTLVNAE